MLMAGFMLSLASADNLQCAQNTDNQLEESKELVTPTNKSPSHKL